MALVEVEAKGSEAKGSERQSWILVSKEEESQQCKVYIVRHEPKEGLKAQISSEMRKIRKVVTRIDREIEVQKSRLGKGKEDGAILQNYRRPTYALPPDSVSKKSVGFRENYHIKSELAGRSSTGAIRGARPDPRSRPPNLPTAPLNGRSRGRRSDDLPSRVLEDIKGNSPFSSTSAAANNDSKRRKVSAAPVPVAAELHLVPFRGLSPSAGLSSPLSVWTKAEVNVDDPPICIICDDGGDLIYCDGPCHRYFHPTKRSGSESSCESLRLTEAEVESTDKFYCPNCKHSQQQCFICGELGSSVTTSRGPPEVRCCDISFCKRFFHVDCAAKLLSGSSHWRVLADAINNGVEKLFCPRHCCSVCGDGELEKPGWMVQCRRCPKAWHRYCLESLRSKQTPVIWDQHDRAFIYCRKHKILPEFQTPRRDHLRFPADGLKLQH